MVKESYALFHRRDCVPPCARRLCDGQSMAVKGVANTLSEGGDTVTSHDDPELIAGAMPLP